MLKVLIHNSINIDNRWAFDVAKSQLSDYNFDDVYVSSPITKGRIDLMITIYNAYEVSEDLYNVMRLLGGLSDVYYYSYKYDTFINKNKVLKAFSNRHKIPFKTRIKNTIKKYIGVA